jgi:cellulose synthase operon protein YhjQ
LPLHYGIQLHEHRAHSWRPAATVVECPVNTPATIPLTPALLAFPIAALPQFSRTPSLPTPFDDGVLPFRAPVKQTLAVFSLTGGTGRTSLAAGLARLLAGNGLRVLLVDTSSFSLLPRLFGAVESRQGIIRNFVPASGEKNCMIRLISLAVEPFAGDDYEQYRILQELQRHAARVDRVVWDLSGAPLDWAAKVLGAAPQILVPLLPNTNSLMQLRATQRFLNQCHDEDPSPHLRYVLNHFDEQDALHRDMRDCFHKALGSKLLRTYLRPSLLIDEALSRGKTIVDYAPDSSLVSDLRQLALQLHQLEERDVPTACTPSEWYEH